MSQPLCLISVMTDSVKFLPAAFAPQYGACSGMPRKASAEPTWTIVPRFRFFIRRSAARVPHTRP